MNKKQFQKIWRPYAILFCLGFVVAIVGRAGIAVMTATNTFSFDYISASSGSVLEIICSVLTGSALVAFMFVAGLVLSLSCAGVALFGLLYAKGKIKPLKHTAFFAGWACALVAIICMLIVFSGIFSPVQVSSMSSKLPATGVLLLGMVGFAAIIGSLLAAASLVVCACLSRNKGTKRYGWNLVLWAFVCGLAVMVCTINVFAAINQSTIPAAQVGIWLLVSVVVNVVIMFVASCCTRK